MAVYYTIAYTLNSHETEVAIQYRHLNVRVGHTHEDIENSFNRGKLSLI
jgi:hypothetical protein